MKTSKLTGPALDWAVAKCEGWGPDQYMRNIDIRFTTVGVVIGVMVPINREYCWWRVSTDWSQGGPIIEREKICVDIGHDGVWLAYCKQNYDDDKEFMQSGSSPLIAAMRCYVASKLGNEVDIPKELL